MILIRASWFLAYSSGWTSWGNFLSYTLKAQLNFILQVLCWTWEKKIAAFCLCWVFFVGLESKFLNAVILIFQLSVWDTYFFKSKIQYIGLEWHSDSDCLKCGPCMISLFLNMQRLPLVKWFFITIVLVCVENCPKNICFRVLKYRTF